MSDPRPPQIESQPPLRVRVDARNLVACLDVLVAVPYPVHPVEVKVVRTLGQGGDYAWLGFVTHHPSRGWERNGLAAQVPGLGAGRRIVVDLRALVDAVRGHLRVGDSRSCAIDWCPGGLVVGDRTIPASGQSVPPVPEVPSVRDSVYLLPGEGLADGVIVESEEGRIRIPGPLVAHLHQRGAAVAELGVIDGDVFLVAQSGRRGELSTDPVIVAPVELCMWSEEEVRADFRERRRQGAGEVEQLLTALDPKTPLPTVLELLDTSVGYVRRRASSHPALPAAVTDTLAESGTRPIRVAVAANPSLSHAAIGALARDPEAAVRAELAANPRLDAGIVGVLAADVDVNVRAAAAVHPALAPDTRAVLAGDPAARVRCAVAGDPATDPELVSRLSRDDDPGVCRSAAANPACPAPVLEALALVSPHTVLGNPSAPESLLASGAQALDGGLRAVVAANPATPGVVLSGLARDPDVRVLRALVTNPASPATARRRAEKRMMSDGGAMPAPESVAW